MPDRRFKPVPNRPVVLDRASVQLYHDARVIPDLICWLDASQLVGFNTSDPVNLWPDLSGNGYDGVSGAGPLYEPGAKNGLPACKFTGNTVTMTDLGANGFNGISQGTVFVVYNADNDPDGNYGVVTLESVGDAFWRWGGNGAGFMGLFRSARLGVPANQPNDNTWHYHTISSGPANGWRMWRDGSLDIDVAASWGVSDDGRLSAQNVHTLNPGWIAEVRIYTRELTSAEITGTEAGLRSKWDL